MDTIGREVSLIEVAHAGRSDPLRVRYHRQHKDNRDVTPLHPKTASDGIGTRHVTWLYCLLLPPHPQTLDCKKVGEDVTPILKYDE